MESLLMLWLWLDEDDGLMRLKVMRGWLGKREDKKLKRAKQKIKNKMIWTRWRTVDRIKDFIFIYLFIYIFSHHLTTSLGRKKSKFRITHTLHTVTADTVDSTKHGWPRLQPQGRPSLYTCGPAGRHLAHGHRRGRMNYCTWAGQFKGKEEEKIKSSSKWLRVQTSGFYNGALEYRGPSTTSTSWTTLPFSSILSLETLQNSIIEFIVRSLPWLTLFLMVSTQNEILCSKPSCIHRILRKRWVSPMWHCHQ